MDWFKEIATLPESPYNWKPEHEAQAVRVLQDAAHSLNRIDKSGGAEWFFNKYPGDAGDLSKAAKLLCDSLRELRENIQTFRRRRQSSNVWPSPEMEYVKRYVYQYMHKISQYRQENSNEEGNYVFDFSISDKNYKFTKADATVRERLAIKWVSRESERTEDIFMSFGIMELIRRRHLLHKMVVQGKLQPTLIVEAERLDTKDSWDLFRVRVVNSRGASTNLKYLALPPQDHESTAYWFSPNKRKSFAKAWEEYTVKRVSTALGI